MRQDLRFIKIQFDAPVFDVVTKDRAATFVNMIGEIGGTMGLLTGFSIISAVEIIYFSIKVFRQLLSRFYRNKFEPSTSN